MRFFAPIFLISLSASAFSECKHVDVGSVDGKPLPEPTKTKFGGCSYFSPIFRAGYSRENLAYIGLGGILPFDQTSDWEGGYSDKGLAFVATKYEKGVIYDLGYASRRGWAIFSTGWEAGISHRAYKGEDMHGLYFGYTFIGSALVRYLQNNQDSQVSIEIGLKY